MRWTKCLATGLKTNSFEQFGFIAATFDEFQLIISEFDDLGLSVELSHGFEVS